MTRTEYYCDTCGEKVRSVGGVNHSRFLGYLVDTKTAGDRFAVAAPEATPKHVCHACLVGFAALHQKAKTIGMEGDNR